MRPIEGRAVITASADTREVRGKAEYRPADALITMLLVLCGLSTLRLR
jgi:hypothetical protein